jgi:ubiquinone/menaquinone biosynthesis C-methylase UbiE
MTTLDRGHRIVTASELVRGERILDVGGGSGALRQYIAPSLYVASDVEPGLLGRDRPAVAASATALPFRDAAFDAVACISVLQYVVDVEGGLAELQRVTRLGGQVLVLVPNLAYLRNVLVLVLGHFPWSSVKDDWRSGTVRYFTLKEMRPMLESLGFRIRAVKCSGRLRSLRSRFAGRLGADLLIDLERVR